MKRIFLSCSILIACILSVSTISHAQSTALEFNDHIASITDSLFLKGQEWGTKFNEVYANKDFALLKPMREGLETFVTARIKELTGMKDVKNSKALRMAMLDFLDYELIMVTNAFKPMERLAGTATNEDVKAALDKMTELSKQEAEELKKVGDAQEAYAKANGFSIAPATAEEQK